MITSLVSSGERLTLYASTKSVQDPGHPSKFKIEVPRLTGIFVGTGDVFAALTVGLLCERPRQLDWVCEQTISRVHALLKYTAEEASESKELALVAAQSCLVEPVPMFHAMDVTADPDI